MGVNNFMLSADEMHEIDKKAKVGERERFTKETIGFEDEFDFSYGECWPNLKYGLKFLGQKWDSND